MLLLLVKSADRTEWMWTVLGRYARMTAFAFVALGAVQAQGSEKTGPVPPVAGEQVDMQSSQLGLRFDRTSGTLRAIENKLTGETYGVEGDRFALDAIGFYVGFADTKLANLTVENNLLTADYRVPDFTIRARYTLRGHFVEKQLTLTSTKDYGLKQLVVSRPRFSGDGLTMFVYRYPKYGRQGQAYGLKGGEAACCTYFGRTTLGGFFTGVAFPFDASFVSATQVMLAYPTGLEIKAGEVFEAEPVYLGVYRKPPGETGPPSFPLRSESDAMVAMTSAILGPPRFGLVASANGWHSQMEHEAYTETSLAEDMRSLDFLASCGVDWLSDSHPWGGETEKMNTLGPGDRYNPGPMVQRFLDHADKVGIKVIMWGTMNATHPWSSAGKAFRLDRPEWRFEPGPNTPKSLMDPRMFPEGNCVVDRGFFGWMEQINLQGLATRRYAGFAMDGDFFGGAGLFTTILPVDCQSDQHDHLRGDSTYASQCALARLVRSVRQHYPDTYVMACRPTMDLGVWMMKGVDVCFTVIENGTASLSNLEAGDQIRAASRARVLYEFLPHYLDQPLLFPSWAGSEKFQADIGEYSELLPRVFPNWDGKAPAPVWPRRHLDYILLSGLSSSPNQHYYLPTKTGIPEEDKAELRRWLDWGRKHAEYLTVRKDLPDWPAPGKVDGSAHILGDHGLVFLFNSGPNPLPGKFELSEESIGLTAGGSYRISQHYPAAEDVKTGKYGETIRWEVPGETVLILEIWPTGPESKNGEGTTDGRK